MTAQQEILNNQDYIPCLDHGFVGLVGNMGSDSDICKAARVSYGTGTKSVRDDRNLIRYLVRHHHTSPLEMAQIKLHFRMPIFVARQFYTHRTASRNEYSARYSVMSDEFYMPTFDALAPQSKTNNQGRAETTSLDDISKNGVQWLIKASNDHAYETYRTLLGEKYEDQPYEPYDNSEHDALLSEDFSGIARELARTVMPVAAYTEFYWSQNLKNMLHLCRLRSDSHAQFEIQVFSKAVESIVSKLYPAVYEAFVDYEREAVTLSRMDQILLKDIINYGTNTFPMNYTNILANNFDSDEGKLVEFYGMSKRELTEFKKQFGC